MRIHVICFGMLREYLPEGGERNRASVELVDGSDVEALVLALQIPYRRVYAILLNGEQAEGTTPLQDGDEVTLMPPFSGGASRRRSR